MKIRVTLLCVVLVFLTALILMKKTEKPKNMPIITSFAKRLLKTLTALNFHALHMLKSFRLIRILPTLLLTALLVFTMISISVSPFAICSSTPILTANAYPIELSASYSRQFISSQFDSVENWREASFIYAPTQALSVPMYVSFSCADNYGEELEKWVSIYDSNNRLCYDSGWVTNINRQSVRSPFIGGSTSMHVYLRVRYRGGDVPLTPNMFQGGTFILDVTRREEVTQPQGWNETTTATYTTATQILPELTTGTQVTIAATPLRILDHERFLLRVLDNLWGLPDVMWITTACIILVFCAWLLM